MHAYTYIFALQNYIFFLIYHEISREQPFDRRREVSPFNYQFHSHIQEYFVFLHFLSL